MSTASPLPGRLGTIVELPAGRRLDATVLHAAIDERAATLKKQAIRPGDRVIVPGRANAAFFIELLALWRLGAIAAVVSPDLAEEEQRTIAAFLAAHPAAGIEQPLLALFTSGTTGDPKCVVHTAKSLGSRLFANWQNIPADALDHTLCLLPTHLIHGLLGNGLTPLLAGKTLHLYERPGLDGLAQLGELIDAWRIGFMSSVPSLWRVALKASRPPRGKTLKRVHVASAPLPADLRQRIADWSAAEVFNLYGNTETAGWALEVDGRPWEGDAAVCAADGSIAHCGEGELLLRTSARMAGYLGRDDLTRAAMRGDWHRTGDSARIEADGAIRILGRLHHVINCGGVKIHPEELDALLERHPQIDEACSFALPDPIMGESVAIALKPAGPAPAIAELRDWCRQRIRSECLPKHWHIVTAIPHTAQGKPDREKMRALCLQAHAS